MTNLLQTHRLIVTLPNTTGEEADAIAENIEQDLVVSASNTWGTVDHALGETLPIAMTAKIIGDQIVVHDRGQTGPPVTLRLGPLEARQLAGVLLAHAHTLTIGA